MRNLPARLLLPNRQAGLSLRPTGIVPGPFTWSTTAPLRRASSTRSTSPSQIAARLRRPELSTVTPLGLEEMELLTATVGRLESKLEGLESDRSLSAMQDLQRLERLQSCEGSIEEDHEASLVATLVDASGRTPPAPFAELPLWRGESYPLFLFGFCQFDNAFPDHRRAGEGLALALLRAADAAREP